MNTIYRKTAAVLAFIIGAMAIFAGGQVVLLGKVMDYYVIDWLPIYNLIVGLLSAFVTSILIWRNNKFAMPAVLATLAAHIAVMLILLIGYGDVVAPDSIRAMTVRIVAWIIILGLTLFQQKRDQATSL
jgi:cell shape-determining protein MreD